MQRPEDGYRKVSVWVSMTLLNRSDIKTVKMFMKRVFKLYGLKGTSSNNRMFLEEFLKGRNVRILAICQLHNR